MPPSLAEACDIQALREPFEPTSVVQEPSRQVHSCDVSWHRKPSNLRFGTPHWNWAMLWLRSHASGSPIGDLGVLAQALRLLDL